MQPLRDLTATATHGYELAQGILVLKSIVIHFMVIAIQHQVITIVRILKNIAGPAAEARAAGHSGLPGIKGELKPLYNDIPGRTRNIKTCCTSYLCATNRLRLNGDRLCSSTLLIDADIAACRIYSISKYDHVTWCRTVNSALQCRQRSDGNGGCR